MSSTQVHRQLHMLEKHGGGAGGGAGGNGGQNITVMQEQEDVFYQDQEDLEEMLEVMLSC